MQHIVWDMGGTLLDTYPEVDRTLCEVIHPGCTDEQVREISVLTRGSIGSAIAELAARHGVPAERLEDAYADLKQRWRTHPAPLMPGAQEVFDAVRAAGRLNLIVTHRDRRSATDLLHAHGLEPDDLVCPDDGFPRKPEPDMHRAVLARHGIAPHDALAVGDRAIDALAAAAAGIPSALLVTPDLPAPEIPAAPAAPAVSRADASTRVIHRLLELLEM